MRRIHWTWKEEEKTKRNCCRLKDLSKGAEGTWTHNRESKVWTSWLFFQLKCELPGWKPSAPCGGLEFGQMIRWDTLLRHSQKGAGRGARLGGGLGKPRLSVLGVRAEVSVGRQIFWLGPATGEVCLSLVYSSELWQPTVMGVPPFGHLSFLR